jgi:hypothetical protein
VEQIPLALLGRLDAPSVAPSDAVTRCRTYRDAVRFAWELRRVRNMTRRSLAEQAGPYAPHVTCYLSDDDSRRALPADKLPAFEVVVGNTLCTQWLAAQAKLTVLEELQASRRVA